MGTVHERGPIPDPNLPRKEISPTRTPRETITNKQLEKLNTQLNDLPNRIQFFAKMAENSPNLQAQVKKMGHCAEFLKELSERKQPHGDSLKILISEINTTWNSLKDELARNNPALRTQMKNMDELMQSLEKSLVAPPPVPSREGRKRIHSNPTTENAKSEVPAARKHSDSEVTKKPPPLPPRPSAVTTTATQKKAEPNLEHAEKVLNEALERCQKYSIEFSNFETFIAKMPSEEREKLDPLFASFKAFKEAFDPIANNLSKMDPKMNTEKKVDYFLNVLQSNEFKRVIAVASRYAEHYGKFLKTITKVEESLEKLPNIQKLKQLISNHNISGILIVPIQISPRFPLYLQNLSKSVPSLADKITKVQDELIKAIAEGQKNVSTKA